MTTAQAYDTGYKAGYRGAPYQPPRMYMAGMIDPLLNAYADGYDHGECDRPSLDEATYDIQSEVNNAR